MNQPVLPKTFGFDARTCRLVGLVPIAVLSLSLPLSLTSSGCDVAATTKGQGRSDGGVQADTREESDSGPGGTGGTGGDPGTATCPDSSPPIPVRPLTLAPNELALRLASFLWRKPADAALLEKTAKLRTNKDVAALAVEMQTDARFQDAVASFASTWLDLGKLPNAKPRDFTGFDAVLASDMAEEAGRFVQAVFADPTATFSMLLTSPTTFVNDRLASLYGVASSKPPVAPGQAPGGDWWKVDLDASQRAGVSTLAGRLTVAPRATARGVWVLSRLFCAGPLPPHPPGIPPLEDGPGSYRQRLERGTLSQPACVPCHRMVDNLGLAFEHLDDVGRFRADDHGFAIDTKLSHTFMSGETITFDGPAELMRTLSGNCHAQRCFVQMWLGQAVGSGSAPLFDEETTQLVVGAFRASGLRLNVLLATIVQTPLFLAH